jgi:hypothetical protein
MGITSINPSLKEIITEKIMRKLGSRLFIEKILG